MICPFMSNSTWIHNPPHEVGTAENIVECKKEKCALWTHLPTTPEYGGAEGCAFVMIAQKNANGMIPV